MLKINRAREGDGLFLERAVMEIHERGGFTRRQHGRSLEKKEEHEGIVGIWKSPLHGGAVKGGCCSQLSSSSFKAPASLFQMRWRRPQIPPAWSKTPKFMKNPCSAAVKMMAKLGFGGLNLHGGPSWRTMMAMECRIQPRALTR